MSDAVGVVRPSSVDARARDADSAGWVEALSAAGRAHDDAVQRLHALLLRASRFEVARRRQALGYLREDLDDLATQAADDALMAIMAKLHTYRGDSRFTTWAYKFVIFEVSGKVARHAWRRHPPNRTELLFERIPDSLAPRPGDRLEQHEQFKALSAAIAELTERQREVFVAIALNEVPIDVLAVQLGTNRNAIYKNLFDARRNLRASMASAGHPVADERAA